MIARWHPRILHAGAVLPRPREPWFVGVPGMNEVVRHLQSDLAVHFNAPVARLERTTAGWAAFDEEAVLLGEGARVIVAAPAPQAAILLRTAGVDADPFDAVRFDPTWTLMLDGVEADPGFDVAIDPIPGIRWMAREASRPHRIESGAWTINATPDWSRANLELEAGTAESQLRALAGEAMGTILASPGKAHRWRYGLVDRPLGSPLYLDDMTGAIACGDWCLGGRVEHAFESGAAAAGTLLRDPNAATVTSSSVAPPGLFDELR